MKVKSSILINDITISTCIAILKINMQKKRTVGQKTIFLGVNEVKVIPPKWKQTQNFALLLTAIGDLQE